MLVGPLEPQDPVPSEVMHALRGDPRVHLVGEVDRMSHYYRAFDLLLLPTYREGLPTVLLEASAMELPVVATRIPGCIEAVRDGVTGTLVPVHDAEALATATRRYLLDAELRRRHGHMGRQLVRVIFDPLALREALFEEYRRLLGAPSGIAGTTDACLSQGVAEVSGECIGDTTAAGADRLCPTPQGRQVKGCKTP
jgi:glycosyltransferase involved in cell wall biosynthesis